MADQEIYPKVCFQIFFLDPVLKQKLPPIGRLKYFISIWEKITGDPWVLQVVQGYQIEFVKPFVQTSPARLPALTPAVETVLDQEVKELLEKQAVHPVDHKLQTEGFVSSMFFSPKKGRGKSPCSEPETLESSIQAFQNGGHPHVTRPRSYNEGTFLVKIGLKDAYPSVPIWKNHQKYLRFLWRENMLQFACLPFGLATAPRVFTKLMKPVALLRQRASD